ncbi:MAG: general secretion pathway protein A, partial [Glaciecola sp.]
SHSLITWVRRTLADDSSASEWQIIAPNGVSEFDFRSYYDPILVQRVASFQMMEGLKADRIIGLKTLLALQAKSKNVLLPDEEG